MLNVERFQAWRRSGHKTEPRAVSAGPPHQPAFVDTAPVLFVDADGTLYSGDILHECLVKCLVKKPFALLKAPYWLVNGRACLKSQISALIEINPETLPYRPEVLEVLDAQYRQGRALVLATAAHETHARAIADRLGIFRDVLATSELHNLKGIAKANAIAAYCQRQSQTTFSYMGDASSDLPIWKNAAAIYAVAPSMSLRSKIQALRKPTQILGSRRSRTLASLRALRPQQWVKNLLVFVPLLTSHRALELPLAAQCGLAFVAFSLTASAVYVANDLIDIEADRQHPKKRHRPFASGALPVAAGPPLILALLVAGFALAFSVAYSFAMTVGIYLAMNVGYSLILKRKLLADVIALSLMYAIRIVAGGEATGIIISEWLFAFSLFFFTSLALVKRHSELVAADPESPRRLASRAYRAGDLRIIEGLGPSSGLVAVLVLALYIASPEVKLLYSSPAFLWLLCPVLYFWIARVWILSGRRQLHHDPVVFAITDWRSLTTWCVAGCILLLATFA